MTPEYELLQYENKVFRMANTKSNEIHYNSGAEHASIVMQNILNTTEKEIKIFAGNFDEKVCKGENYVRALKRHLLNNKKVKIILNEFDKVGEYNLFLDVLKQYYVTGYKDNIDVRLTEEKPIENDFNIHFTIGDDRMYRLEYDTQNFIAEFSFNRPEKAKQLNDKFNTIFQAAQPLNLEKLPF